MRIKKAGLARWSTALSTKISLRLLELLPGSDNEPVSCLLRSVEWIDAPNYEALSYAWGDPSALTPVFVNGKRLDVTVSLHIALKHLRYEDQSRVLWADAICINQLDIPERGHQVSQMRRIFQQAKTVLIWIGPDTETRQAQLAVESILTISDFLCQRLGIPVSDLDSVDNLYYEVMTKYRDALPVPNNCGFSTEAMWKSLVWFYSHPYFTRVWAIQEANANSERLLYCGLEKVAWNRVSLVACYITIETAFSQAFGFTSAYCWWAATMTTDLVQPKNWLLMLYLASTFSATDPRDVIYGLRSMVKLDRGEELLEPDYSKTVTEAYRDSVEAGLVNFNTTDVLLYVQGIEDPSWIPRWDIPMLFRNPFRFGKPLPWKPAGGTRPKWAIDKDFNILNISGFIAGSIKHVEPYNESLFGNFMEDSPDGRESSDEIWKRILKTISNTQELELIGLHALKAAAVSFCFALDENSNLADEDILTQRFVAYLELTLDEKTYRKYIPEFVSENSVKADGKLFGKPVRDFKYPESSFFITENNFIGCCVSPTRPDDVVFVAHGSTYPLVLRPDGDEFRIRGFAYIHGLMHGEQKDSEFQSIRIR
ncbi:heterokaryon incompatibility protein-domain-containing protein [Amylocarpus encephaloides]|uniref:Heterokaryon incompatibility protein-domain-containing protein n=1 Tax=Amylocarpus encephaloides TaxID=45428 RepID=A0A9P8C542_9HELO|nr:heterokaryon incompatibility protein-domain-containing protein [Amylocarpus encephaloides]